MQALGNLFNSIKGVFTSPGGGVDWGRIAQTGVGATGLVGNILAARARNKELAAQQALRDRYAKLTPQQVAEGVRNLQRPLSAGLTKGITNSVQAAMAERGLSQSPSIFSEVLAQALAPFQQNETERASRLYMEMLGLPLGARPDANVLPTTQPLSSIFRDMLSSRRPIPTVPTSTPASTSSGPYGPLTLDPSYPAEGAGVNWWDWANWGSPDSGIFAPAGGGG